MKKTFSTNKIILLLLLLLVSMTSRAYIMSVYIHPISSALSVFHSHGKNKISNVDSKDIPAAVVVLDRAKKRSRYDHEFDFKFVATHFDAFKIDQNQSDIILATLHFRSRYKEPPILPPC